MHRSRKKKAQSFYRQVYVEQLYWQGVALDKRGTAASHWLTSDIRVSAMHNSLYFISMHKELAHGVLVHFCNLSVVDFCNLRHSEVVMQDGFCASHFLPVDKCCVWLVFSLVFRAQRAWSTENRTAWLFRLLTSWMSFMYRKILSQLWCVFVCFSCFLLPQEPVQHVKFSCICTVWGGGRGSHVAHKCSVWKTGPFIKHQTATEWVFLFSFLC